MIFLLTAEGSAKASHALVKPMEELGQFNLENNEGKWSMKVQIAHHSFALKVMLESSRSWIKEAACIVCDKEGDDCKGKQSCHSSHSDSKISCDSTFCTKIEDYRSK